MTAAARRGMPAEQVLPDQDLGMTMTFPPVEDDRVRVDAHVRSGRGLPPHVHPSKAEVFRVLEGEIEMLLGLRRRRLRPSDEVTVPAGASNAFVAVGGDARVLNDFVPGLDAEAAFRELFAIAERARRRPLRALLDVAVLSDERPLVAFYAPVVPWRLQRAWWRAAGAVARRLGGRRPARLGHG